jgi:hypothetical protein
VVFETKRWSRHPADRTGVPSRATTVAGSDGIWTSNYGRELTRWAADEDANAIFQPAWYATVGSKAGYLVEFVAEHGDEVWFGGRNLQQPGPIPPEDGRFSQFLADGFQTCNSFNP